LICLIITAHGQRRHFFVKRPGLNSGFFLEVDNMRWPLFVVLLLISTPALAQIGPRDERNDPVATLASYYDAINSRDYRRAYGYWESPTSSYDEFVRGFAGTNRVRLLVEPPARVEGAAGSLYTELTTVIVATTRAGNERVFAGCYVLRRSNVRDRGWQIYRANVSTVPSSGRISRLLSQGCR